MSIEAIDRVQRSRKALDDLDAVAACIEQSSAPYQMSKPELASSYHKDESTPAPVVCARLMNAIQNYVFSNAEPAELKQEFIGGKIDKTKKTLRHNEKNILQSKKAIDSWQWRKNIAGYLLNGVSVLAGVSLCSAGQVGAGASLIASGAGSSLSQILASFDCNATLTGAISIASSVVGIFGTLGFGAYSLVTKPHATLQALGGNSVSTFTKGAEVLTSFAANGFTHVATIKKNQNLETLSQLEALHTRTDTMLRTLDQKHSGAATAFSSNAKNFSDGFRTISKAHIRFSRAMRVLTAEFAG